MYITNLSLANELLQRATSPYQTCLCQPWQCSILTLEDITRELPSWSKRIRRADGVKKKSPKSWYLLQWCIERKVNKHGFITQLTTLSNWYVAPIPWPRTNLITDFCPGKTIKWECMLPKWSFKSDNFKFLIRDKVRFMDNILIDKYI